MSWINRFFKGNFKYYLATFSLILIFTFIILEIVLRSISYTSGVGIGSGNERWNDKYWTPINKFGYRDYEILINDSRPSIVFLGDSFTAGHGVKFEETFFYSVRQSLDENYRAINLGRSGSSTLQQKHNLSELISKINPNIDTFVFQIFGNDVEDYVKFPKIHRSILRRGLSRVSDLFSLIDVFYIRKTWVQGYMDSLFLSHQNQTVMTKHLIDINSITSSVKKDGAKVIFLAMPFLSNNDSLEKSEIYISKLRENFINMCSDGDYFIDVSPMARNFNDSERVVSLLDHHASKELNFQIGLLLKRLLNNNLKEFDEGVIPCS